ncbi:MAG: Gfo/Idh/MocA family oxidoreductase [Planctomycetes bacterium]|nr:Gfo/Idh/MocA family oxidoreductase [Planctomycetota bacterium]
MTRTESNPANGANFTRRDLLGVAAAVAATGCAAGNKSSGNGASGRGVPIAATAKRRRVSPNDKLRVGIIGCGSMGVANLDACASQDDVVITALCDVWEARLEPLAERFKATARCYREHEELCAADDVDCVIVASPPHWHALHAIDVVRSGKDLYLQKPMTLYPDETLAVRNAVRRHGAICQVGTQIHATEHYRRMVELVRSGYLGKIGVVRAFNVMNQGPEGLGLVPDAPPPVGLDWERWVGPAKHRAFNEVIVRDAYHHGSFWDFSGGWTPGMAPHLIDLPHWALELGAPKVTNCSGGRYVLRDLGDVPDVQEITWQHPGLTLTFSMSMVSSFGFDFGRGTRDRRIGIYFHGVNGTLRTNYSSHEVFAEGDFLAATPPQSAPIPPSPGHEREWLDCVRSRTQPSCNADYHANIDLAIGLANLSYRLGRAVEFDGETETIVGDAEARKLARPEYRAPWRFPKEYLVSA